MTRLIARLDIKGRRLIKGIQYEGVRVVGDALEFAKKYYAQGVDEIVYIDSVASLYGRPSMNDLLMDTVQEVFVPVTAGGGVTTVEDAKMLLSSGADKVAVNTAAIKRPELISDIAERFGSQCMVLSVQAKRTSQGNWEAYMECGREKTGIDVQQWVGKAETLGAGEILLTSVDQDGTGRGADIELIKIVSEAVTIPVIASGGISDVDNINQVMTIAKADAVAIGKALHFEQLTIEQIKNKVLV